MKWNIYTGDCTDGGGKEFGAMKQVCWHTLHKILHKKQPKIFKLSNSDSPHYCCHKMQRL